MAVARRATHAETDVSMLPGLTNHVPFCEVMDAAQAQRIDEVVMSILENVGVVFRAPIALADRKRVGADVRGEVVVN